MSKQIQIRRGSATEHENFTGAIGEITMDTTNKTLRIHDGETAGGIILAKQSELESADYVIESQMPTEENGYTWYRKYKSGWLEQGGRMDHKTNQRDLSCTITLIKPFNNIFYYITITGNRDGSNGPTTMGVGSSSRTTTSCFAYCYGFGEIDLARELYWIAKGIGA